RVPLAAAWLRSITAGCQPMAPAKTIESPMNTQLVTIITGGGGGNGKNVALRMAKETTVLLVGRTQASLESVCQEIRTAGGVADFVTGDVSDPEVATKAVEKAEAKGWTIRTLVCNAGIGKGGPATSFDKQTWRNLFDVNVHGAFWFIQACLPTTIGKECGCIAIMSSIAGVKGFKYASAYCATKHRLVG